MSTIPHSPPFDASLAALLQCATQGSEVSASQLATAFNARLQLGDVFSVSLSDRISRWIDKFPVVISFEGHRIAIELPRFEHIGNAMCCQRLLIILPVLVAANRGGASGRVVLYLEDSASTPGLTFSSNSRNCILLPDADFIASNGYEWARAYYLDNWINLEDRKPFILWRGSTTGVPVDGDWRHLDRIKLCQRAQKLERFDVGLTSIVQIHDSTAAKILSDEGLMRSPVSPVSYMDYQSNIDIDGNSNAWSSCFIKLLAGSPILKILSRSNFQQWYYDKLRPFQNYIPVASDLTDLEDKAAWLFSHSKEAKMIGLAGRELALSLTYETQMIEASKSIRKAIELCEQTKWVEHVLQESA